MRLLSPEAFGVVGMALMVIGFVKLVGDMGFNVAIVQRPSLTQEHIRVAFTSCMSIGIVLFSVLWFITPAIARLFMHDELVSILRAMAIAFVFSAMSATPIAVLRRELKFRTLAGIETASYFVGYGLLGIALAMSGFGVWSLVAANVLQPLCLASLAIIVTSQSMRPFFRMREFLDLFPLASAEVLNNVTNYIAENLHFFVVGKWLGAFALGLYSRSFYLMYSPLYNFSAMLFSVMFPLLSQVQADASRLRRAFIHTVSVVSIVTIPLFFAVAAVPEVVIGGLFGGQWKGAAGVLRILCLSGPFMALMQVFGAVNYARAYVFNEWGRQAIYLMVITISIGVLLSHGIEGVALAVAIASVARFFLVGHLSLSLVGIGWKDLLFAQVPGYVLGINAFASAYLASSFGNMWQMPEFLQLLMIMIVCMLSLSIGLLMLPSSCFGDLYPWIVERFGMHFPHAVRKRMLAKISPCES
jgi:PST family polysaccharide transporter